MLRVASNALIVPPFEGAWLQLSDYQLDGSCCLQFECKGENDVTIIFKPFPGGKRWQHLQRQQGAAGEQFAVEPNYTVILGSHRNSKLKIEKNGDEKAGVTGLPGCTVTPGAFTSCWINYSNGCIAVGTGPVGSSLSYIWQDPEVPIADVQHIGLSCWDKHVSYRNVQLLPAVPHAQLQELRADMQRRMDFQAQQHQHEAQLAEQREPHQQRAQACMPELQPGNADTPSLMRQQRPTQQQQDLSTCAVPALLQLVQHAIVAHMQPADVCHMLQLSEALLPRTQHLYEQAVQLAGEWFGLLAQQHLQEIAMLPLDVLMDVTHEPLLDVSELAVFQAVAAWCQAGMVAPAPSEPSDTLQQQQQQLPPPVNQPADGLQSAAPNRTQQGQQQPGQQQSQQEQQQQQQSAQQQEHKLMGSGCSRSSDEVWEVLQLVRFALMSEVERQAVLDHPFTQACHVVQQCMQEDLQRVQDYHSGRPSSTEGGFRCQQRRLVLPARAAQITADGQPAVPLFDNVSATQSIQGRSSADFTRSSLSAQGSGQLSAAVDASASGMQTQGSAGSSLNRASSGWLARSGSSGSASARQASGWCSYRRRLAPSCKELMYVCDGDRHGVIHHIATDYGTKPWVNPVLSKALEVKASSPPSRYTDPKALVSGQFLNTSFAGPRYVRAPPATLSAVGSSTSSSSRPTPSTWWQLDLGPQHRLLCNYYVIRHDGSQEGYARSWCLQGSNDLQHWLDLRRHTEDTTIRLPGQYGSWPVSGPAACMPFRAFRLLLTGPTQSPTNPWTFCLSYWELYGYFYKLRNTGGSTPT